MVQGWSWVWSRAGLGYSPVDGPGDVGVQSSGWSRGCRGYSLGLHCHITSDALHGTCALWGCEFQGHRVSWLGSQMPPPSASRPHRRTRWPAASAGPSGTRTRSRRGGRNEFVQFNDLKSSHSPNILLTFLKLSSAEQLNN